MSADRVTVKRAAVSPSSAFIRASDDFVQTLVAVADRLRESDPGTAELLLAYAEREAGLALDLIRRWP